mgnify:CR=1 FL=1
MQTSELTKHMNSENPQYVFAGMITNKVLDGIAAGIEDVLSVHEATCKKYRKIFSIFIEMTQNIIFYSDERVHLESDEAGFGALEIALDGTEVKISAANPISREQRDRIGDIMDLITRSSADEIIAIHKAKMFESMEDPNSRGAGLGYLDIAKKSVRPVHFGFEETSCGRLLFHISAWA